MQDTVLPKKRRSTPQAEADSAQSSGGESESSGVIAEQLQSLFGNQVVEEALSGQGGITAFASILRDATKLNNLGVANAGPVGTLTSSLSMDMGSKAREAAQGAMQNGVDKIAGEFTQNLGPASDMLSGFAMRSAKGGGGGFSQGEVAGNIKGSSAQSLPSTLSTKLSLLMGMDMSSVRIHTDAAASKATEAMSAHAFALGSDVFFNSGQFRPGTPEGDALIVHELTHVMQDQMGQLPTAAAGSGITTSSPSDGAEVQAVQMAGQLAGMLQLPDEEFKSAVEGVIKPMQGQSSSPLDGFAMRSWNPFGRGGMFGADEVSIRFNGATVSGPLPEGAEAGQTVQITLDNNIEGVTFSSCTVTLDDDKQPASGSVSLTVQVGEYVGPKTATLSVGAGGQVSANVTDVPLRLGGLASGQMTCEITSGGVTGAAQLNGTDFNLSHNFSSDGGSMAVELRNGEIRGEGTITGQLQGIGTMQLAGSLRGAELTGLASVTVEPGLQVVPGVTIASDAESMVSGTYTHSSGCQVEGQIVTDVKDFMRGTVTGSMDTAAAQWNATGTVDQTRDYQVGNVTISNGMLAVEVENGAAGPMEGVFNFTYQEFTGTLEGTYDPSTNIAEGAIECSLTGPKALGEWGTLEQAEARGTMTESTFEAVTGSFTAKLKLQSQDTFQLTMEEGSYTASSNQVSGQATFTTLRDIRAPQEGGSYVKIPTGATASASIEANQIGQVDGALTFEATDGQGTFASGTVQADFTGGVVNGTGTVSLTTNYGIPTRADEMRYIHTGATLTADVQANELQTIQLSVLAFTVKNPSGASGQVDGTVTGTFDLPTPSVDGSITTSVVTDWDVPVSFGTFAFTAGGTVTGNIAANELQTLEVDVPFSTQITGDPQVDIDGNVTGTLDVPGASFSGSGAGTLVSDAPLTLDNGHQVIIKAGSSIEVPVQENAAERLTLTDIVIEYHDSEGKLATGTFTGELTTADLKATGTGEVTLDRDVKLGAPGAGERLEDWQAVLNSGGSLGVTLNANIPEQVTIDLAGRLEKSEEEVATGQVAGTMELGEQATGFTGTAGADFSKDVEWKEGTRFAYFIGEQTSVTGGLAESQLTQAAGLFSFLGKEDGTPKVQVDLDTTYVPGTGLSGSANLKVLDDIEVWSNGTDALVATAEESSATATVENDVLTNVSGNLGLRFDEAGDPLLQGAFSMNWAPQEQASLDGTAQVTTLRDYQLGQASGTGLEFVLDEGASIEASLEQSTLKTLSGEASVTIKKGDAFARGTLDGDYDHTETSFDGTGSVTVLKNQDVGAAYPGGKAILKEGTGATGEVEATELKTLTVSIPMQLDDDEAGDNFAQMELQGTYDHAATTFDGTATAQVNKEKEVGTAGDFTVKLMPDSGASVTVATNELTEVSGTVKMQADTAGEGFASAELSGSWTKDGGMNGTGSATLLVEEYEVATLGTFKVYVIQGTGAEMTVANNEVTSLTGRVPFEVRKGSDPFLRGSLTGTADLQNETVSGNGTVEVVQEQQLATFGETSFWVTAGSGISVDFADNAVTHIGGNLNLSLRQPSEFLTVNLTDGSLDLTGATPMFSGTGAATVTREQEIFSTGSYRFAVTDETSAQATLADNQITSITGTVGFRVYNTEGALLSGAVEGNYDGTTGFVTGSGRADLEQEQRYGPNDEIRVLPGTGGQADVANSEVTRVVGTIVADLHDSEGALVHMEAEGEFDAVTPELVRLSGSATLLRDLEPIPGVIISNVTGTGTIEHNAIVEVGGTGNVTVEAIGLTGSFDANWAVEGGEDKYWGSATVGLGMDKPLDGNSARGVTGASITAELTREGQFNASGTVNYQLTDKVGGSITLSQEGAELDPVLAGDLHANGTLVEGRELFKWEKTLLQGNLMAGPIPIAYGVKGAMGMTMRPVTYDTTFAVSNFHLLEMNVPDFRADLEVNGGADFFAKVLPYVGVGVSFGDNTFTALGGLEGQAGVNIGLDLGIQGTLEGANDQYSGELGIGATITPSATLSLTPFAEFRLLGMGGRHDFANFSHTFSDLFQFGWETTYSFGDRGSQNAAGAANTTSEAPSTNESISQNPARASETVNPSLGVGTSTSGRSGPEGGPQIAGSDQESGQEEGSGTPSRISEIAEKATILADGVRGIQRIIGILGSNPVSAVVDVITNFDEVQTAVNDVIACVQLVADLITPLLPDWWETLKGWIADGVSVLADAAGMILDGGRWLVNSASDALSAGWEWATGWW